MVERAAVNRDVAGSSPASGANSIEVVVASWRSPDKVVIKGRWQGRV